MPGVANSSDGRARTGIVDVFGVDDTFFGMSARGVARPAPAPGHALLNRHLADQLGVGAEGHQVGQGGPGDRRGAVELDRDPDHQQVAQGVDQVEGGPSA